VRDICNLAGTNPGAVSYHFGGKRQLYRTVLRQAAEQLAAATGLRHPVGDGPDRGLVERIPLTARRLLRSLENDPVPARLLLRDIADGGGVAVEALAPTLRSAYDAVRSELGMADLPRQATSARLVFLRLAAPLFLATAAWPVLEQALELVPEDRENLLVRLLSEAFE
jgi:AcrR family transcriptional regulator